MHFHVTYSVVVDAPDAQSAANAFVNAHDGFGDGEVLTVYPCGTATQFVAVDDSAQQVIQQVA